MTPPPARPFGEAFTFWTGATPSTILADRKLGNGMVALAPTMVRVVGARVVGVFTLLPSPDGKVEVYYDELDF